MSSTLEAASSAMTRNPGKTTKPDSGGQPSPKGAPRKIHVVLQGKGGIGKTLVASYVAQHLKETGRPPVCFDTDPVNGSFVAFSGLNAQPVTLLKEDAINVKSVDELVEKILTTDAEIVIDNGAASFLPLSRYLTENGIAELVEAHGKQLVVHAVIVGGGNAMDTAKGLDAVVSHFPASVRVVVWINEFFGEVAVDGVRFEETGFYAENRSRMAGIVTLRSQNQLTFGANIGEMLTRHLTFEEALADPEFLTVPRQRLTMYRREIWQQLAAIL